jgi:hypothetical protein
MINSAVPTQRCHSVEDHIANIAHMLREQRWHLVKALLCANPKVDFLNDLNQQIIRRQRRELKHIIIR